MTPAPVYTPHLFLGLFGLVLLFLLKDSAPTELSAHCLLQMYQLLQGHVPGQRQEVHQEEGGKHWHRLPWWRGGRKEGQGQSSHSTELPLLLWPPAGEGGRALAQLQLGQN